jgi:hypothetical protein
MHDDVIHTPGKLHQHAGLPWQDLVLFVHFLETKIEKNKQKKQNLINLLNVLEKVAHTIFVVICCPCTGSDV